MQDQTYLEHLRRRLRETQGREYWQSLNELGNTPEFQKWLAREFPQGAAELKNPVSRRTFLQLAAASLGMLGLAACTGQPEHLLVPYVEAPEKAVPGEPLYFATADTLGGYAFGVLAETHMGRPTRLEGNRLHPASLGATTPFNQGAVLTLYDPDRLQTVYGNGRIRTWSEFLLILEEAVGRLALADGAGLRILSDTITSPTLSAQIDNLLGQLPQARWHQYEPVSHHNAWRGALLAFGETVDTLYDFTAADVILSLEDDFLGVGPGRLAYTRAYTDRRRVLLDEDGVNGVDAVTMNRLYVVEGTPTLTGAMADHRRALRSSQIEHVARGVARALGLDVPPGADLPAPWAEWIAAVAADLQENRGRCLVTAGITQPPAVHALAHAMNAALDNVGATVSYVEPVAASPVDPLDSLAELVQDLNDGAVEFLLILGGNPVYTAPAEFDFATALTQATVSAHLTLHPNETAVLCDWALPQAHFLESWSDALAFNGVATIVQPVIEPLYAGRSAHELVAAVAGNPGNNSHDLVRQYWQAAYDGNDFDGFWRTALHDGVVPGTSATAREVTLRDFDLPPAAPAVEGLELIFRPDPSVWDGRYNNNAWLQELPKPFSKITWDNVALVSPALAARLELANSDVVVLRVGEAEVLAPVWIMPGQADDCIAVHLGYGRTETGRVGSGAGFNAYPLRTSDAFWVARGLEMAKTGRDYVLASTQDQYTLLGRDLVRAATLQQFRDNPDFVHDNDRLGDELPSLYPEYVYDSYAWGMSIDLNTCIGCNACIIACQAENNIPVVGKEQVENGRVMHWLKVDGYFQGTPEDPNYYFQPRPCMHCEKAPCEVVCPVEATTHSSEGINEMTYNRCVGTRYCSNNCPYKVRRFNFLDYTDLQGGPVNNVYNPNVTVRSRGVMEKCTYCIQRINRARVEAEIAGIPIPDGAVETACQEACPAQAIIFGDANDPDTQVALRKLQPHNYAMLRELGTRPRTTYLAKFWNPNPAISDLEVEV